MTNLRKCYKINLSGILVREASSDMRLYKYAKCIKLVKRGVRMMYYPDVPALEPDELELLCHEYLEHNATP